MAKQMIYGTALTLTLILSANLAQAVSLLSINRLGEATPVQGLVPSHLATNRPERHSGVSKTLPPGKANPRQGADSIADLSSPPKPGTPLPGSISQFTNWSPLGVPRYSRFEPPNPSERLLIQARRYLDTPYRRGSSLQSGRATDCSGFVQYIYKKSSIDLPRVSAEQARVGKVAARTMDFSRLQAGDLLFFRQGRQHIGHVGIYLGEGKMIHASSNRRRVTVSDLHQPYYHSAFVVAKRLIEAPQPHRPAVN